MKAFAKQQLSGPMTRQYLNPNGQLPAYEWNFSDVNPPVHAWATWFVHRLERAITGHADGGANPGSAIVPDYQAPFQFTAPCTVTVDVSGDLIIDTDTDSEMRLAMDRQ